MQQMNSFTEGMVTTAVCVLQSEKDRSVLDFESFIFSRGSQILTATVKHTHTHTRPARLYINPLEVIVHWRISVADFAE